MEEKLQEYFEKGVRLVWYVRPRGGLWTCTPHPTSYPAAASMRLDGGDVLPGFSVQVSELFEMPKPPGRRRASKKTVATRQEEGTAARPLTSSSTSPTANGRGACTDHAQVRRPSIAW